MLNPMLEGLVRARKNRTEAARRREDEAAWWETFFHCVQAQQPTSAEIDAPAARQRY
jgi:hypothetical protein